MLPAAQTVSAQSTNANSLSNMTSPAAYNEDISTRLLEEILHEYWPDPTAPSLEKSQSSATVPEVPLSEPNKPANVKARKRKPTGNPHAKESQSISQNGTMPALQFEPVTPVTNGPSQSTSHPVHQRTLCQSLAHEARNSIRNSLTISENNIQTSQSKLARIETNDGSLNAVNNLLFAFDSSKYIADLYDNFIAPHITTPSDILTSMRKHYYKQVTLDLTIATLNAGLNLTPEVVFLTFIDVVSSLALLPQ